MIIGLVLSQTPVYSETFFNSKIKGLQDGGFEVQLFVQRASAQFKLCTVHELPKVYKRNPLKQAWLILKAAISLLPHYSNVNRYIQLERRHQQSWSNTLKRVYLNAPLLASKLDWLHFGFATMALQRESVAKTIGAKMAVSCRGYDMDVYPLKFPNVYKTLWQYTDKVHAISQHMLHQAKTTGMPETMPYSIITPAIDLSLIDQLARSKKTGENITMLSVGRLHPIKGFMETLEALALLKSQHQFHQFNYKIIGSGELYEPLTFAIYQLGLTEEVSLVPAQPHEVVLEAMASTAIYIQYSHSEGFCNAVLEAQALGCVCIVSDGGALPENVVDGITGFVVPKRQPDRLAKALLNAAQLSEKERDVLTLNAAIRVKEKFSFKEQQEKFAAFYQL